MSEDKELIDSNYIDNSFVTLINSTDSSILRNFLTFFLTNYSTSFDYQMMDKLCSEFKSQFSNISYSPENFIRQLKYLVNKGIFGRIIKKYKSDLIGLGIKEDKVEVLAEVQKKYYDNNFKENEKKQNENENYLKDFDMLTEMPIQYSKYKLTNWENDDDNIDIKKQNLLLNLRIAKGSCENNNNNNNETSDKREVIVLDKNKLIGMYMEIEKMQEILDKMS